MKLTTLLRLVAALACSAETAFAQPSDDRERIAAAFLLGLGRAPSPAEMTQARAANANSVADLLAQHRQQLAADRGAARATAGFSYRDAFGRPATDAELEAAAARPATYTDLMRQHLARLAAAPADYTPVLDRAYRLVIHRGVYPEEIEYWKKHDPLPFALLVGCIEDWARRNQPGLMVTAGTPTVSVNSEFLTTARLSPSLADEARRAIGLGRETAAGGDAAAGQNVVAPGAAKLLSSGRIHFVAVGRPMLAEETTVR